MEPFKTSKTLPDVDEEMQHLLQYFKEGKEVMLIKPCIPGETISLALFPIFKISFSFKVSSVSAHELNLDRNTKHDPYPARFLSLVYNCGNILSMQFLKSFTSL